MTDRPMPRKDASDRFVAGISGNPKGRPKGARNKLGEAFIHDMYEAWQAHGSDAIDRVIEEKPEIFLKVVASLLPKEMALRRPEQELTDGELVEMLDALKRIDIDVVVEALGDDDEGEIHNPTHGGSGTA